MASGSDSEEVCWSRKKSICGVALQLRRCGAPVIAPHSSVFARLASGAFYEIIKFAFINLSPAPRNRLIEGLWDCRIISLFGFKCKESLALRASFPPKIQTFLRPFQL